MKTIINLAMVATAIFFSIAGMAQNKTADSLAKQGDFYLDRAIPSTYQPKKALQLYIQAGNLGNARAMNAVGMCHKLGLGTSVNSQTAKDWFAKAANAGYTKAWYNLGFAYKDANDYENAYLSFCKAANLNDAQSVYAKAYMLYKGFGCSQNYTEAAKLFAQGAYIGKSNSMYFYGLCLRNGYGVAANKDSARYWLMQSSNMGYTMANDELAAKEPEHAEVAGALAQKIRKAQAAMPPINVANQYQKVQHQVAINEVAGIYKGYLLKYDWSGQHIIEANKLSVTLSYANDSLKGIWQEDDSITLPIKATLTSKAIIFNKMQYSKTNHYSADKPELAILNKAHLQLNYLDTLVYLSGNIEEFIPSRNEPSKPLYLALQRVAASNTKGNINLTNEDGSFLVSTPLRAYPNPFGSTISIDFELKEASEVKTELLTMEGKVIYSNPAGTLAAGSYSLPIQTQKIAAGYYTLVLHYGNKTRSAKVVKL